MENVVQRHGIVIISMESNIPEYESVNKIYVHEAPKKQSEQLQQCSNNSKLLLLSLLNT